jgi:RNA 3'-terminal phosphate cyclase (ATP)
MLQIDGSKGEGGGQIVRTSLALSMLTGQPVTISEVRANRAKPGLARQHLVAVQAAGEICDAEVEGDRLRSRKLVFKPRAVRPGTYHFSIGSAGSATLVLQTILPPLLVAAGPSSVTIEGGTHNPMAPPFEAVAHAYLPLVQRMGPQIQFRLKQHGFYPAGGGRVVVDIIPVDRLNGFELLERAAWNQRQVRAVVSKLPRNIGERECETIARLSGWPATDFCVDEVLDSPGPGNVVLVKLQSAETTEIFTGFGERGVRAEVVAERVWDEVQSFIQSATPVGPHLADQLILPLAISAWQHGGGGAIRTSEVTGHAETHLDLVAQILEVQTSIDLHDGSAVLRVASRGE